MRKNRKLSVLAFRLLISLFILFTLAGCGGRHPAPYRSPQITGKGLARMGYTIQTGAFAKVGNASRMTESLRVKGLNAFYFAASDKTYKVRFGNFTSRENARNKAELLVSQGIIDEYYIVAPGDYAVARGKDTMYLRKELVKTAKTFLGVPYLWGGVSPDTGFDCSGLTMAVYQLNGLDLPRLSTEQYEAGIPVSRDDLLKGDLIFFAISKDKKVSHVGIYIGDDNFIHAPGRGKKIRRDSLSDSYFQKRYIAGKTYF
ncbi:MAG: NlpC/P60 family protein [Syntrophales bacterium]|nr:NlpC/P60 family protein [Syntrophales bacterium]